MALEWFRSYLSDRTQFVSYNGCNSETMNLKCGVPQGSVLGPLLFIIYTNDLPNCLNHSKSVLFADDTTIFLTGNDAENLFIDISHDFINLVDWFMANKLFLNLTKTNYILFKPNNLQTDENTDQTYQIKFGNEIIQQTSQTKFLGIYIDENLNWNQHCNNLCTKLSAGLYLLRSSKQILPVKCLKTLYYSFIYSYITKGVLLWGLNTSQKNLKRIIILQKKAMRYVINAAYNAHTDTIFKSLEILKLLDVLDLEMYKFTYSFTTRLLPPPLLCLFEFNKDIHSHDTRQKHDPRSQKHKSTYYNKSFLNKCPVLWSSLLLRLCGINYQDVGWVNC